MSVHTPTPSVAAAYVHRDKLITPANATPSPGGVASLLRTDSD